MMDLKCITSLEIKKRQTKSGRPFLFQYLLHNQIKKVTISMNITDIIRKVVRTVVCQLRCAVAEGEL